MKYKLCVVAPDKQIADTVRTVIDEVGDELQSKFIIIEGDMETGVRNVKPIIEQGVDAIVSRGGTAYILAQIYTRIPVISIQIDAMDILKTVRSIPGKHKIGFISYSNVIYQYQAMASVLGVKTITYFRFFDYGEEYRVDQYVREAKEKGCDILIGGAHVRDFSKKYGIQSVYLGSGKDTVLKAIREAETALQVRQREKDNLKIINDIVDHAYIGVAVFDKRRRVQRWNTTLLTQFPELTRLKADEIAVCISSVFSHSHLTQVLKGEYPEFGEIIRSGQHNYAVRWHTIRDKQHIVGATAFVQGTEELQTYARTMRKKMQDKGLVARYTLDDIVGRSLSIRKVKREVLRYARTRSNVLITGESGTGKEMLAQAIHNLSDRRHGPFVAINCGAFSESLLESELFGYESGAFTGAQKSGKAGVFELADGGTLFLDEIGDMPYVLQNRLLRVLQERAVMRVGGSRVIPVDVRIVAATNQNLEEAVEKKQFRLDLYYRLDVLRIQVPALRERSGDIPLLAKIFLDKFNQRYKTNKSFASEVYRYLSMHTWPGNVRQLMNAVERMALLSEKPAITLAVAQEADEEAVCQEEKKEAEPELASEIEAWLKQGKTYDEIAVMLGISRSTLWRLRKNG